MCVEIQIAFHFRKIIIFHNQRHEYFCMLTLHGTNSLNSLICPNEFGSHVYKQALAFGALWVWGVWVKHVAWLVVFAGASALAPTWTGPTAVPWLPGVESDGRCEAAGGREGTQPARSVVRSVARSVVHSLPCPWPCLQELVRPAAAPLHQHMDPEHQRAHRRGGGAAHPAHGAGRPGPGGQAGV